MIFVLGPAFVTVLATEVFPAAGVIAAALLSVTGTLLLARQRGTEPAPTPRPARPAAAPWLRLSLPTRGMVTLAPVFGCLGSMFAAIDLSTVAFAAEHGHKPLAGVILGTYALGSAIGGFWYGSRSWRVPLERRFALTLCCTVAGVATFWAMPGLQALDLVVFVSGLTISPTIMAGFSLIERQAPAERRTEALAWLSSTIGIGVAIGSAASGHLIDAGGGRWGYLFAAGSGVLACAVCLTGRRRLRGMPAPEPADWVDG
jgi:MFS family permease